jgi:hypothetical protein
MASKEARVVSQLFERRRGSSTILYWKIGIYSSTFSVQEPNVLFS